MTNLNATTGVIRMVSPTRPPLPPARRRYTKGEERAAPPDQIAAQPIVNWPRMHPANMTDMFCVATSSAGELPVATSSAIAMTWKLCCTQKFARLGPIIPFEAGIVLCVVHSALNAARVTPHQRARGLHKLCRSAGCLCV